MERIPFSAYDFWAYLSSGFLLLLGIDHVNGGFALEASDWTFPQGLVFVAAAYVLGHAIAGVSSALIEGVLVRRWLGSPRESLFELREPTKLQRHLFPFYFRALPLRTRSAALFRGAKSGSHAADETLFWVAHVAGRKEVSTSIRLDNFLGQYGFCRNVAMVAFIDAVILAWSAAANGEGSDWSWCAVCLGLGIVLTYRYLKFYRLFSVELFTSFAYGEQGK
jgi:hypothetical protein